MSYEKYKEIPVTGGNTLDLIPCEGRRALIDIEGTAGTLTGYRSITGEDGTWEEADAETMEGTFANIALTGICRRGFIRIVSSATITAARILWED